MASKKKTELAKVDHSVLPSPLTKEIDDSHNADRCKVCKSTYREEAEKDYFRHNNISRVHKFLVEDRGLDVSITAVRNHMLYHFKTKENMKLMQEYAKDVVEWIDAQSDDMSSIRRTMAIIEREMWVLGAETEECNLEERRKTSDSINKLANTLLSHRMKIIDLEAKYEPVTMIFNQLQVIVQEEVDNTKSKEAKDIVFKVLSRLEEECGNMIVDQE